MRYRNESFILIVLLLGDLSVPAEQSPYRPDTGYPRFDAKQETPGLHYGSVADFALPKTLLYSVSVDELLADAAEWVAQGYGGFFLTGVAGEWSADIWAVDGAPWTVGASDETLKKVRLGTEACSALGADVFLTTAFSHPFDWFDDVAWQHIENRFRQMAIFARDSGCAGLAIDVEYIHQQYHFIWEGYTYDGYSRRDLVETIRRRMTGVAAAMYDVFPEMVLLTLPEGMVTFGSHIQTAWIEEAARRNAPGGVHLCTEFTYRRPNVTFMLGHPWMINEFYDRLLSDAGRDYWRAKGTFAEGLWVFGEDPEDYHGVPPSPAEFRQAFASSLMAGARYNWIYSHNARPQLLGREQNDEAAAYRDVIKRREIITDSRYLDLARSLRSGAPADFEEALGLTIVPTFAGPREELEIGLMPRDLYLKSPQKANQDRLWEVGLRIFQGEPVDVAATFGTQTSWHLIGPFENPGNTGYDTVYPPEDGIDLGARYETPRGPVVWQNWQASEGRASIDLTRVFTPTDDVCAYALCYLETDHAEEVHLRVGANDGWKLWVDGKLLMDYPDNGRIILDREVIPVRLKPGRTPVLLKVCNERKDWGFMVRVTTPAGESWKGKVLP
jgi:hypothetical protein